MRRGSSRMLEIKNLSKSFRGREVLRNITCEFGSGVYGILGPNGAGKTTLLRHLVSAYSTKSGIILYNGKPIKNNQEYMSNLGYLPQKFGLFKDLTLEDALKLFACLKRINNGLVKECVYRVLVTVGLEDRKNDVVGTLSGGMIRRAGIAQALIGDPEIVIFDEPTAGLDPEERLRFKNIISEIRNNRTIIISTHIVEDAESICDTLLIMNDGDLKMIGTCDDVRSISNHKVYVIPKDKIDQISGDYIIQKRYSKDGVDMLKIITNSPQNFTNADPNIEDGYICVLKGL